MTAPTAISGSGALSVSPQRPPLLSWLCAAVAVAAAILLWGVGAEAVHLGHGLSGALLLADAAVVSALEAATIASLLLAMTGRSESGWGCCHRFECLASAVDTYRRAVVYALLTVPCFVQLHRYWLPAVPGTALIVSVILYTIKHVCSQSVPFDFGKMPTFVRFEDDCCLAPEAPPSPPPAQVQQHQQHQQHQHQQQHQQHQPSWISYDDEAAEPGEAAEPADSRCGSRDSGIEQQPPALPPRQKAKAKAAAAAAAAAAARQPPGDRRRLINVEAATEEGEGDCLSLCE